MEHWGVKMITAVLQGHEHVPFCQHVSKVTWHNINKLINPIPAENFFLDHQVCMWQQNGSDAECVCGEMLKERKPGFKTGHCTITEGQEEECFNIKF